MTRIALVTGASRGLGAAMAVALAPEYHILAVARTVGGLEDLDDRIKARGGSATLAPLDVTNDGAMQHLCLSTHDRWGGVDLWVHSAIHAAPMTPTQMIDAKDWDPSVAVNIEATRRLIGYVEPLLQARKGRAVFLDDDRAGRAYFGCYGATKAAQMALVRSWAAETQKIGPEVRILAPQPVPTALRARFFPGEDRSQLTDLWQEGTRLAAELAAPRD
ncbi:SDR family oxidoreductase [Tropicimonas sp. IMCC34043]|uniref:SDR family oxidoreductase n=1 Tax=Tropicimonas sp. IMCC34043 TaxID=2248760 RepID=UPI000E24F3C7|nr:SDR family oxidoreductase [Tropicimonas sp. IMCC34043]